MDIWILDSNYEYIDLIDSYNSLIWSVRFNKAGDFELNTAYTPKVMEVLKRDRYLTIKDSDRYMIIETIDTKTDYTTRTTEISVTGRSLESILDRRIVWNAMHLNGNLQNEIKRMLNENVIAPTDPNRVIPNFSFKDSTDPAITSLTVDISLRGEDILDVVETLCDINHIGFRVLPKGSGGFEFELFTGVDRSYEQTENPWVIFSSKFNNLLGSNYLESSADKKTVTLVTGVQRVTSTDAEGVETMEEVERTAEVKSYEGNGLARREIFSEASVPFEDENGHEYTQEEFVNQMKSQAKEFLNDYKDITDFEGEIEAFNQFVYGRDFHIGDIVQVANEFNKEDRVRISEVILSHDENGILVTPTFTSVKSEEETNE